jgi:YidC/Oxa1 family membrane protein insertase
MEKRVLLAVSLSFVVLVLYQTLFVKQPPRRAAPPPPAPPAAATIAPPSPPADQDSASTAATGIVSDDAEREIVVESPLVRAVFSNRGAELKSWQLKKYFDNQGRPVDIIPAGLPASELQTFALVVEDATITQTLKHALFRPTTTRLDGQGQAAAVGFEYEDNTGLRATKTIELLPGETSYIVSVSARVEKNGAALPVSLVVGPGIGDTARAVGSSSFLSPSYYQKSEAILQQGRDVTRVAAESLAASPTHEGTFTLVGIDDQYFLGGLLPGDRNVRATYEAPTLPTRAGPRQLVRLTTRVGGGLEGVRLFLGPKEYDVLAATDRELVRTINFGIFDWLVVPLLRALNWIDGFVGNYGWSIILLTLLINAVIAPLRHRSVVSMRKMQELQPQVKAIQERYANLKATDPARQKMNVEMMNLYREKGVNPASGCVPLLLTMPVLFAFYSMLSQAIELRGAPFVGWINDLSVHDPYYVTPLLMGASMVWQQRLTPTTADPVQQKVMMFMPVMFTFMFLWAPSGLVIYWFVSNLWAIGQQYVTNRLIGPPKVVAVRPPAERRIKTAGAGRTNQAR